MDTAKALDQIAANLKAAAARGLKPAIRVSGGDWVCTLEDKDKKSVTIVKEGELLVVHMDLKKGAPDVERVSLGNRDRDEVIERIKEAIAKAYGAAPAE